LSRVRTLSLIAALAAMTMVFASCGSSDGGSSDESPQDVLKGASFEGIENADLDVSLTVSASGDEGGDVDVSLTGPFQSRGKKELPELDLTAEATGNSSGEDIDFEGGVVLLPNKAFIEYEGTTYEVDSTTFGFAQSAIEQAQNEAGGAEETTACQEAATEVLKPGDFVDGLANDGSADVGGTETTKVSGDLDVSGAIDALSELVENPACSSQLEAAGPLPLNELDDAKAEIEKALKTAHADVYVGEDKIIRRITAEFEIAPEGSDEKVDVELDVTLNGVNEGQEISAPEDAEPLEGLFQKLGVNPLELLQATQGGNGLGGLLEGITGESVPDLGGSGSGGSGKGEGPGAGNGGGSGDTGIQLPKGVPDPGQIAAKQKKYLNCIKAASTPVDLQNCAKLIQ
jgi:hypothetical protein